METSSDVPTGLLSLRVFFGGRKLYEYKHNHPHCRDRECLPGSWCSRLGFQDAPFYTVLATGHIQTSPLDKPSPLDYGFHFARLERSWLASHRNRHPSYLLYHPTKYHEGLRYTQHRIWRAMPTISSSDFPKLA